MATDIERYLPELFQPVEIIGPRTIDPENKFGEISEEEYEFSGYIVMRFTDRVDEEPSPWERSSPEQRKQTIEELAKGDRISQIAAERLRQMSIKKGLLPNNAKE